MEVFDAPTHLYYFDDMFAVDVSLSFFCRLSFEFQFQIFYFQVSCLQKFVKTFPDIALTGPEAIMWKTFSQANVPKTSLIHVVIPQKPSVV